MNQLTLVGVATSVVVMVTILVLIRQRRLQERYAIIWLVAGLGVVVFGAWSDALRLLADVTGVAYPPSALFMLTAVFLLAVLLHTGVVLSRLSSQNQTLAQRMAILDERVRDLEGAAGLAAEGEPIARVRELGPAPRVITLGDRRARAARPE